MAKLPWWMETVDFKRNSEGIIWTFRVRSYAKPYVYLLAMARILTRYIGV